METLFLIGLSCHAPRLVVQVAISIHAFQISRKQPQIKIYSQPNRSTLHSRYRMQ